MSRFFSTFPSPESRIVSGPNGVNWLETRIRNKDADIPQALDVIEHCEPSTCITSRWWMNKRTPNHRSSWSSRAGSLMSAKVPRTAIGCASSRCHTCQNRGTERLWKFYHRSNDSAFLVLLAVRKNHSSLYWAEEGWDSCWDRAIHLRICMNVCSIASAPIVCMRLCSRTVDRFLSKALPNHDTKQWFWFTSVDYKTVSELVLWGKPIIHWLPRHFPIEKNLVVQTENWHSEQLHSTTSSSNTPWCSRFLALEKKV